MHFDKLRWAVDQLPSEAYPHLRVGKAGALAELQQAEELLEAVKGMLELERHTHRLPNTVNQDWLRGIIADARAAIAKAEGEEVPA